MRRGGNLGGQGAVRVAWQRPGREGRCVSGVGGLRGVVEGVGTRAGGTWTARRAGPAGRLAVREELEQESGFVS